MPTGPLTMAALNTGQDVVNTGMGLLLQRSQDKRQLNMQRKLQRMQMEGTKEMTDYNYAKQLQMWRDTNYPAQMDQLKLAGLNPGLIYGMSGGGGQSTNIAQGSAPTGQAPTGGGEVQAMLGMGIQRELLQAQKENIQAQTEKTKAETTKTAGVDTQLAEQTIEQIKQNISSQQTQQALTRAQTLLTDLESQYQSATMENRKSITNLTLSKLNEEVHIIENDRQISDATKETAITTIKRQSLQVYLENELIKTQTGLTNEQITQVKETIKAISAKVAQDWKRIGLEGLSIEFERLKQIENMDDDDFSQLLRGLGIILPIPGGKGHTPIRGFHQR